MVKFKYNFLGSVPKICQLIQLYNFIDLLQPKKKKKWYYTFQWQSNSTIWFIGQYNCIIELIREPKEP